MPDLAFEDLGYDAAGRVLACVGASSTQYGAAQLRGDIFWRYDERPELEMVREIRRVVVEDDAPGLRVDSVRDCGAIAAHPIVDETGAPRAWLVAWNPDVTPGEDAPDHWKRTCETLPRVADMLSSEGRVALDLAGAVDELSARYEELNIVYRMERVARDASPDFELIRELLRGFLEHMDVDVGMLVTRSGELSVVARGTDRPISNLDLVHTELGGRVWRFASASHQTVVMNEENDSRREFLAPNLPFKVLAIPSSDCGNAESGLLLLRSFESKDFMNSDLNLARVFLGQALMLAHNHALLDEMEGFTRQMAASLVEAIEAKDPYTRGHSERVELICGGLGEAAGVSADDHADLLWGALLHDVGKIGIPDSILMKPGRLTDDEYTFIKTHPMRGYEILRHIERLGPAALDAARYHQERFDGSGYPYGLAGAEIPLCRSRGRGGRHLRCHHELAVLPTRALSHDARGRDPDRDLRQTARSRARRALLRSHGERSRAGSRRFGPKPLRADDARVVVGEVEPIARRRRDLPRAARIPSPRKHDVGGSSPSACIDELRRRGGHLPRAGPLARVADDHEPGSPRGCSRPTSALTRDRPLALGRQPEPRAPEGRLLPHEPRRADRGHRRGVDPAGLRRPERDPLDAAPARRDAGRARPRRRGAHPGGARAPGGARSCAWRRSWSTRAGSRRRTCSSAWPCSSACRIVWLRSGLVDPRPPAHAPRGHVEAARGAPADPGPGRALRGDERPAVGADDRDDRGPDRLPGAAGARLRGGDRRLARRRVERLARPVRVHGRPRGRPRGRRHRASPRTRAAIDDMASGQPGDQPDQRHPPPRRAGRRQRHPHRAASPQRCRIRARIDGVALHADGAADRGPSGARLAPQGDGEPRHRRAPAAPGRSHAGRDARTRRRSPLQLAAGHLRREGRPARPGQEPGRARRRIASG